MNENLVSVDKPVKFGNRRLVGQEAIRSQIERTILSERVSHAFLFTGPAGSGKTAFALALAEWLNGIDNLTDLNGQAESAKSSWFTHPDIHLFIPLPTTVTDSETKKANELKSRLELLRKDPYEIVDFRLRPVLDDESSQNKQAFYPIDYFHDDIRKRVYLKPNEGHYTIIILTDIELMKKEASNAFLKILEEPPKDVIFILTATGTDKLLPTIVSRCRQMRMTPLSRVEIAEGLIQFDDMSAEDAKFMARISGGNYALTRFFDMQALRKTRDEIVRFLREAYIQDGGALLQTIKEWDKSLNTENQIALCNTLETFLRDLMIYRETSDEELITNIDQKDVITRFCSSLSDARLADMIEQLQSLKGLLYQNIQFKLIFTVLAMRFSFLMRGKDPVIGENDNWKRLPALEL